MKLRLHRPAVAGHLRILRRLQSQDGPSAQSSREVIGGFRHACHGHHRLPRVARLRSSCSIVMAARKESLGLRFLGRGSASSPVPCAGLVAAFAGSLAKRCAGGMGQELFQRHDPSFSPSRCSGWHHLDVATRCEMSTQIGHVMSRVRAGPAPFMRLPSSPWSQCFAKAPDCSPSSTASLRARAGAGRPPHCSLGGLPRRLCRVGASAPPTLIRAAVVFPAPAFTVDHG